MKGSDIQLSTQEGVSSVDISGQTMEAGGNRYSIKSIPLGSIYGEEIGTLIIALSQKDLAAALKKLRFTIILLALGSILIAGLLGLALTKTLTSPLNKLVRLTEQVGSGRFPEETSFSGSDEVSVLGRHFLEMTKKLKDQKKALASYTTGLEDAVMKRTRELFNSREEWISTFNAIKDYILIVDRDYSIVRANKTLLDRIALTNQELSGKKCYEVLCGEKGAPDACPIKTTLETKEPSFTEIRYYKLGEYFMASAAPLSIKGNIITNIVYVVKDITERHNMQLQMINAEKLASMGQMAAGFAHEINNPMAAIAGCTELLIDQLDSNELKNIPQFEYFHDYLNIIYREAFRCKDIIRGMLRFSRRQFEKSTVEVDLIIREILSLLDHIIKHQRINVVEEYKNTDNSLHADEGEIRQIFLALVVNAIDAMPEGGTLTIKTMESVEGIRVTVHDTGPGIPRDVQNRIFEPFFTTKPVGKGTGLGLFIAFNMVKKYHGKLELESTNGQGSIFSVSLPVINTAEEPE
ncbi:MAG TPA: HAMP domain-containing sensor histidine kinase, partial [Nitrospirae bacterium]|nr:HAMP domain-containing sensor histidine kinase [Nitrospirota bacterium]